MRNSPKPASLAIETMAPSRRSTIPGSTARVALSVGSMMSCQAFSHRSGWEVEEERGGAVPADVLDEDGDRAEIGVNGVGDGLRGGGVGEVDGVDADGAAGV